MNGQRNNYQNDKLSKDRIKRLEEIDFVWNTLELQWEEMFDVLKEYKKIHGYCNIPQGWIVNNLKLGTWVQTQRGNYQNGKLSEDRIKSLEDIGFVWDPYESTWEEMFDALNEYEKLHGHCNVPTSYVLNGRTLGIWVSTQRSNYQNGKLSEYRIKRLEDIGFVWDPYESTWEEMFGALNEYKKIHGHCNVPRIWLENKQLSVWVKLQRNYYQKGNLSIDRINRLEEIGFVWEQLELKWEEMFNALNEYKKIHGNCNVPKDYREYKKLGTWVGRQRTNYQNSKLSEDRIERLEEIGFEWEQLELKWEEMFNALNEYKKIHGNCNVPKDYREYKKLGTWVHVQRSNYQNGKLSEDRIKRLEDIGFTWERLESKWEEMFNALKEYEKIHGDCDVPSVSLLR